ncbi:MAG: tyrosinase family protein [Gammaproteobacteria bacterium]|nr:tyrosinase family protein [Gammaproteobacteria bacterium]
MAYARKSAFSLTKNERDAYIKGITDLIADGSYGKLVAIHSDMRHNMHSMGGDAGMRRFLPWHRAYVLHMEQALRSKVPGAFVPYWNTTNSEGVPDWIKGFQPEVNVPGVGKIQKDTRINLSTAITSTTRYSDLLGIRDYNGFTSELESDPHNKGHVMLGAPMKSVPTAPADPMFFMHHAEIDRIWALWQAKHPPQIITSKLGNIPNLSLADAVMDPWTDTVQGLLDITALGYSYA